MIREQRWEMKYMIPAKDGGWTQKVCYPRSEEQVKANREKCAQLGYKVKSCRKLYPFSTIRNQHNFELIHNICFCRMDDMDTGEVAYDKAEYSRMADLREKAEKYFCYPLPVAWVPWEEYREMKEISQMAILHRQDACIANGRPDLVAYC